MSEPLHSYPSEVPHEYDEMLLNVCLLKGLTPDQFILEAMFAAAEAGTEPTVDVRKAVETALTHFAFELIQKLDPDTRQQVRELIEFKHFNQVTEDLTDPEDPSQ